jgi:uncharacterized membrane protein YfcA
VSIIDAVLSLFAGVLTGLLSAIFGVGGGLIVVPYMVLVFGASQHLAEGTSLVVIIPTALAGALTYSKQGLVDWKAVAYLAIGGAWCALIGASLAHWVSASTLQGIYAAFLLVVAYRFLVPRRGR